MRSIATRLMIYFSLSILFCCAGLGLISYQVASSTLMDTIKQDVTTKALDTANLVSAKIEGKLVAIEGISVSSQLLSMDWKTQQPILQAEVKRQGYKMMLVATPDGQAMTTSGARVNVKDRDYFKKAMAGVSAISEPIVSRADNTIVIALAAPIIGANGSVVGVVAGVADGTALSEMVNFKFAQTGYGYMVDKTGNVIAHPKAELVMNQWNPMAEAKKDDSLQPLAAIVQQMVNGEQGYGEYLWTDGVMKFMGYAPVKGTNWSVAVTAPKPEVLAGLAKLKMFVALAAVLFIGLGVLLGLIVGRKIAKPLKVTAQQAEIISQGDLTVEMPAQFLALNDEVGKLTRSFDAMLKNLRAMVQEISVNSQDVAASSEELAAAGEDISASMEEIAASTQEISAGMEEVSASSEEINASGQDVSGFLGKVNDESQATHQNAREIEQRALAVQQGAEQAQHNAVHMYENIKGKILVAIDNARVVEQISGLAEDIAGIADQTNLLALNAAIEAARAGEQGRGFAVVAEEVRKLAENSSATVSQIHGLTRQVQDAITNLVNNTNELLSFINNDVVNDYSRMLDIGKQYKNDADILSNLAETISGNVKKVMKAMVEIGRALESTTATIEETTAGTLEIAKGSDTAAHSAEEISMASARLAQSAEKLNLLITRFKI
ncbi:MAG: methyl-accepting chemotaxis protein [Deltaproteobacteria bacterium]